MPKPRAATSYKLPPDAKELLDRLAEKLDTSKTYVLALALRKLAKSELGKISEKTEKDT